MYRNLDECLSQIYKLASVNIQPMGNTAQVINHLQGASGCASGLTQAEWHANAAMIESQVAGCLNSRLLVAVVECQYGKYDNLYYVANAFVVNGFCNDTVFMSIMLQHIYSEGKHPREIEVLHQFDLSHSTFWRVRNKLKKQLADWEQQARFQLQTDFKQKGIISA